MRQILQTRKTVNYQLQMLAQIIGVTLTRRFAVKITAQLSDKIRRRHIRIRLALRLIFRTAANLAAAQIISIIKLVNIDGCLALGQFIKVSIIILANAQHYGIDIFGINLDIIATTT